MRKVVVIDDDSLCLRIVVRHLEQHGFQVLQTDDSTEALMLILQERPDAIVTDIDMPGMSGWELIRVIRSWTHTALIPAIFLTHQDLEADRRRGFSFGVDEYLAKPVRADHLLLQLESLVAGSEHYLDQARRRLKAGEVFSEAVEMLGIPSLLSLLEKTVKTGTIALDHDGRRGSLTVNGGKLYHAALAEDPTLDSVACVNTMLGWSTGRYQFTPGPAPTADLIARSTTQLLLDVATVGGEGPSAVNLQASLSGRRVAVTRKARMVAATQSTPSDPQPA